MALDSHPSAVVEMEEITDSMKPVSAMVLNSPPPFTLTGHGVFVEYLHAVMQEREEREDRTHTG